MPMYALRRDIQSFVSKGDSETLFAHMPYIS